MTFLADPKISRASQRRALGPVNKEAVARVTPAVTYASWLNPEITFEKMLDTSESNMVIDATADFISHQVIGPGIYLTSKSDKAKKLIAKKFRKLRIDQRIKQTSREVFLTGLSVWKKMSAPGKSVNDIRIVPLESIEAIQRDENGDWVRMKQSGYYDGAVVEASRLIVFRDPIDDRSGYGRGIMHALMTPRTIQYKRYNTDGSVMSGTETTIRVPPPIDQASMMEYETLNIFQNFGAPWFGLHGVDSANANAQMDTKTQDDLTTSLRKKQVVVSTKPFEVKTASMDPRARFVDFLDDLRDRMVYGTRAPIMPLLTRPGYTQASAREARRLFDRTIVNGQRVLKRVLEEDIILPALIENSLAPSDALPEDVDEEVDVKVHFGPSDRVEFSFADLNTAVSLGWILPEEAREFAREMSIELKKDLDEQVKAQIKAAVAAPKNEGPGNRPGEHLDREE